MLFLELVECFKTNECFKILVHRFRFWNVLSCLTLDVAPNGVTVEWYQA